MWAKEVGQRSKATAEARPAALSSSHAPTGAGAAGRLLSLHRTRGNRFVGRLLGGAKLQPKCACGGGGGTCAACASQEGEALRRQASRESDDAQLMRAAAPVVHEVLRSPGRPLDAETREFMESRFGYDFGGVRVHTDSRAAESARAVDALAYTVGQDVVFDEGRFRPDTQEGRRLLAHELTHVMQQGGGAQTGGELTVSQPHDREEQEADSTAERVMAMSAPGPSLSRSFAGRSPADPRMAFLAGGLEGARESGDYAAVALLERAADQTLTQPGDAEREHATREPTAGGCTACTAARVPAAPQTAVASLSRATLARQSTGRSRVQCINANLANAGIPWAIITIAGGVCGLLGAVAGLATGPGAPAASPSAAAVGAAYCISAVTGAAVGTVLGVIIRCIQDPSVEWVFAQNETGSPGARTGETATA